MRDLFQDEIKALDTKSVLVPYPIDKAYDYALPTDMGAVAEGDYVRVPLGGREVSAVIWGQGAGDVAADKVKPVLDRYALPAMPKVHRDFLAWVARYTCSPLGSVLKMSLSAPDGLTPPAPVIGYRLKAAGEGLTDKQQAIVDVLAGGATMRASELVDKAGVGAGVVKTLVKKGVLEQIEMIARPPCTAPDHTRAGADLSPEQRAAADILAGDGYKVALLDGVTGAGKTEVYFEAVAKALAKGGQVLILLPEIALSNAFLSRFEDRFGCAPALWHSGLTKAQRRDTWRGVAQGQVRVVIGARSALFLPYTDLGLIVVDEEHDPAYKQEDGVRYHARDMAVVRGALGKFPVVLVSATPALETMHNVWAGRYTHVRLPARYGGASMPSIELVDLREDKPERGEFIAPAVKRGMEAALAAGEQALLFLNRRGYAPLTLCRSCGHRIECPRCTAWMVEHKRFAPAGASSSLQCHHCGFSSAMPEVCPSCGDTHSLVPCGPGVERIAEEAKVAFPDARIMVLASDTAESGEDLRVMLNSIAAGEVDIIIGTQIVAKGHHFPLLTFVGVIDADLGLQGGELRASERVYQLLHQVAGRAGRAVGRQGRVMLQSFMPEHAIMQALAAGDRDAFLEAERKERETAGMPPYSRLVGIIVTARDEKLAFDTAKALGRSAPQEGERLQTLGPAPAPLSRLRGRYRFRLLVRADKSLDVQQVTRDWVASVKVPSTVRVTIDIDPQSFL